MILSYSSIIVFLITVFSGGGKTLGQFSVSSVCVMLSCIAYLAVLRKKEEIIRVPEHAVIPFLILSCLVFVSLMTGKYLFAGLKNTVQYMVYVAFFLMAAGTAKQRNDRVVIALLGFLSIVQVVIIGIQRYLGTTPAGLFPKNPVMAACFIGTITVLYVGIVLDTGTYAYLRKQITFMIPAVLVVLAGVAGLAMTNSRGCILAVVCAVLYIIYKRLAWKGVLVALAVLLVAFTIIGRDVRGRYLKTNDPYAYSRLKIWESSVQMIKDSPVYGVGLGHYGYYFPRYNFQADDAIARYGKFTDFAHNELLQLCTELGIPGMLAAIWLFVVLIRFCTGNTPVLSAIMVMFINALFNFNLHLPANVYLIMLLFTMGMQTGHVSSVRVRLKGLVMYIATGLCCSIGIYCLTLAVSEYHSARGNYYTALRFNPIHAGLYASLAGDSDDMSVKEELLQQAIMLNSEEYRYYYRLAGVYHSRSMKERMNVIDAIRYYKKMIIYNQYDIRSYYALGRISYAMKEYDKARAYFLTAYTIEPNFIAAVEYASKCSTMLKEYHRARKELQKAVILRSKLTGLPEPRSAYERMLIQ